MDDVTDTVSKTLVGGAHAPEDPPVPWWWCDVRVETVLLEFDGPLVPGRIKSPGKNSLSAFIGGKPGFVHVLVTVLRTPGTLTTIVIVPMTELGLVPRIMLELEDPTGTLLWRIVLEPEDPTGTLLWKVWLKRGIVAPLKCVILVTVMGVTVRT